MSNFFTSIATGKPQCNKCSLHKSVHTPKFTLYGEGRKGIFIVSSALTSEEDYSGIPLSTPGGKLFTKLLQEKDINIKEDCWVIPALRCHVTTEASPLKYMKYCHTSIRRMIKERKPKKIFLIGKMAIASYYQEYPEVTKSIEANRGLAFWDAVNNCYVFPLTDPEQYEDTWDQCLIAYAKRELLSAIEHMKEPPAIPVPAVRKLITVGAVIEYLEWLLEAKPRFAYDYEATGLKPQLIGHKCLSVGICTAEGAVAFALQHRHWLAEEQRQIEDLWRKVLADRRIKKIVQAAPIEYIWSTHVFGETNGIIHDTQLASHMLDNRKGGIYGLKFQAFLRWGVRNYSKDVDQFIKPQKGSSFNRMESVPLDKLLQYQGLDALYTWNIYLEHQKELVGKELEAYRFFHRSLLTLCEMSINGMAIDIDYYKQQYAELQDKINKQTKLILDTQEAKDFEKIFKHPLNIGSTDDIVKLFFKQLKLTATKFTNTNKEAADIEVLENIKHPLAKQILAIRKIEKINNTYVKGFIRENAQGRIHSFFQLHRVSSFRGSSSNLNYQNISKRDAFAKKVTRTGMVPDPGCVIGEGDFSGAEVGTSACYHKDKNFIKYLLSSDADLHMDCARDLWLLEEILDKIDPKIKKLIRQNTKSDFVFSQFYGSYWKNCGSDMWDKRDIKIFPDGTTLQQHLRNKGIKTKNAFLEHVKRFEDKFWGTMFPEYKAWKQEEVNNYIRDGYIDTYLGFRYRGLMTNKQICNYSTQGTSSHILFYVAYELNKALKKAGMKTKLIGNIHDSLISSIPTNEVLQYARILKGIMSSLQDVFEWLVVPIKIEFEISRPKEEGGSFANMEEIDMNLIENIENYEDMIYTKTKGLSGEDMYNSKRIKLVE